MDPHMAEQKLDNQLEHTYSSYVRIRDVALKTCKRRWTIGKSGESGLGISMPAARHDDDEYKRIVKIEKQFNFDYSIIDLIIANLRSLFHDCEE